MSEKEKPYRGALTAYRIVRAGFPVCDGSGAARWGGRWTGQGRAVIHAAESYALAVLESLVHFNSTELPPHLLVCEIKIPENVSRQIIRRSALPDFDVSTCYEACQALGDRWHEEARTALLIVPSRLSPYECNMLVHPKHADVAKIAGSDPSPARHATTLAKKGARIKITDCGGRLCIVASKRQSDKATDWHGIWNIAGTGETFVMPNGY